MKIKKAVPVKCRIRSFVRRERRLTLRQQNTWNQLGSEYILDVKDGMLNLSQLFPHQQRDTRRVIMEIGFGSGEMLWQAVRQHPIYDFIGIEVYRPGVANLLTKIDAEQHFNNVRLYNDDAIDVLTHCIPAATLSEVWLLFPDPWPKKRHHKRRIVQPYFATLVNEKLVNGGLFRIVTDAENYAWWSREIVTATPGFSEQKFATFQNGETNFLSVITKFAGRAIDKGSVIWEMEFMKTEAL